MYKLIFTAASLATLAFAKTDIGGCTSSDVSSPAGASMIYYVPGTGEICEFLDCGGGRAPPKTTVPGCPQYSGTETYSPSFLPGYGAMETGSSSSNAAPESTSTLSEAETSEAETTAEETGSAYAQTTGISTSSLSHETTLITSPAATPPVVGGAASNASTTVGGGRNSTITSGSPVPQQSTGPAMETARVWVGGVAMLGLGAVVAAL
ncbi:hypothetical protein CERZMDRAFT_89573 [Cercospora zeae-maydis SCOH1-5]|uniref:Siderophore biosynthesis enzyme n=1 Tax=Cercospora zeae-maydis SCOH1-5 TaxID=717836 RepID=A0A6A6FWI9_9PEZI|nr:hypothetical protein CERZMDRAFT_89573 [Cercospora zeae-maydis SCOH1-5]